jgi:hypothetical protein
MHVVAAETNQIWFDMFGSFRNVRSLIVLFK